MRDVTTLFHARGLLNASLYTYIGKNPDQILDVVLDSDGTIFHECIVTSFMCARKLL